MRYLISIAFSELFATKVTPYGKKLFYITDEKSNFARMKRTGQLYRQELDPERAVYERL